MSYVGNTPTQQAFTPAVDFFNGNGSTTAFTLSRPVASVAQVQAVISNVPQKPGDAFTVSGNTITFTSAPPSGTQNIYVYYTSPITQVIAPGQDTVATTQIQAGAVTPAKLSTGGPSWDTSGTVTVNRASNGVHLVTQVSGVDAAALGSFNSAPTVGSNKTGYSGVMFNGASIEPTLDGLNTRQSALVDVGSTGYRFKVGHFTGINFPAAQSASSDPNTLDDYEEGEFTPTIGGISTAGTGTYSGQKGKYTKIGNRCLFQIWLDWTNISGAGGSMVVRGLPFTSSGGTYVYNNIASYMDRSIVLSANSVFQSYVIPGDTKIYLAQYAAGGGNAAGVTLDSDGAIMLTGSYEVA